MDATRNRHEGGPDAAGRSVTVTCSARLHLGFFDLTGAPGRRFGSIGLSLDRPNTVLTARTAASSQAIGAERERVARYVGLIERRLGLPGGHVVEVREAVPPHAGLGSGTQLALAVACAVRALHGRRPDLGADAACLGRGGRSGIGLELFRRGGLVVDGGKGGGAAPPPLLARLAIPQPWRVLLLLDRAHRGLSGAAEQAAFAALPPMRAAVSGDICRLVLMRALPALAERNLAAFGSAIEHIQAHVGDHFAPAQGGRTASPAIGAALRALRDAGAHGIGQSSWGPTGFAFVASAAQAEQLAGEICTTLAATGLDLLICRGLNRGASVTIQKRAGGA